MNTSKTILVVAPHADDETLGCGGTILKHLASGDAVHWLIATNMQESFGYSTERVMQRRREIAAVAKSYPFSAVHDLGLPPRHLDEVPMAKMVEQFAELVKKVQPEVVYVPFPGDVHTDHAVAFDATIACTKWFRHSSVKRVLAYETLSETEFGLNPTSNTFRPNVFSDIKVHLEKKLDIMKIYQSELGDFPFPRSEVAIRALAELRGAAAGFQAAEAFMLLKEIVG